MKINKLILSTMLISMIVLLCVVDSTAQCPMCRTAAASNLANGGSDGKGLNFGILYMLAFPYVLVATIGIIWWRNRKEEPSI